MPRGLRHCESRTGSSRVGSLTFTHTVHPPGLTPKSLRCSHVFHSGQVFTQSVLTKHGVSDSPPGICSAGKS
eukprot:5292292-Prymnesium_polylepis.1